MKVTEALKENKVVRKIIAVFPTSGRFKDDSGKDIEYSKLNVLFGAVSAYDLATDTETFSHSELSCFGKGISIEDVSKYEDEYVEPLYDKSGKVVHFIKYERG